jgi:UDP-N-acetylmuramate: L-alanyl-gamma-D-glutamyl-meso-diaminopimelate ligase
VYRDSETAFHIVKRGYSRVHTFGFHPESDHRIEIDGWVEGVANFRINGDKYQIPCFGKHNICNASAVAILGTMLGFKVEEIQKAFSAFQGVKRRMELRGEANGISVYDDFAHHPTAIRTTLEGVRLAYPKSRIWGVFEPRSWSSRRNIFHADFARAFGDSDIAVLAPVFEPEKLPSEIRLDPEKLIADIEKSGTPAHYFADIERMIEFIATGARPGDKIILMSNGAFDNIHERLLQRLN